MPRRRSCSIRRIAGASIPREFLLASRLDLATLRRSEDSFVGELIDGVVARGYPDLMRAHFPRCYVDVNREPYELDPRMFDGRLPSFANTRSMRVAGGLGTVARVVGDAQEIYDQRISVGRGAAADRRPLQAVSSDPAARCSCACTATLAPPCWSIAIPCRRAPAQETSGRAPIWCLATATARAASRSSPKRSKRPCAASVMSVSRNKPYAGGFITEHYGNPTAGLACDPA